MAKKEKKTKEAPKEELKKAKKSKAEPEGKPEKKEKGKKKPDPEPEPEKKEKGKKNKEPAPEQKAKKVKGSDWDEQESGGGDFLKLDSGTHLFRCRSVISLGQVHFVFNKKRDTKATSAMGFVLEAWPYKIKGDKIKITSDKPAILYPVFKAYKGNDKANYTKMLKAFVCKNPGEMQNKCGFVEVFTSDKGYMYVKKMDKAGLAEMKAVPKLTQEGYVVPNLDCMTVEAMKDLNPITQVKDYVLEAVNFPDTAAEKCVNKIRKDKPDFATLSEKPKDKDKKKGKKKKQKLSEDEEY